MSVVAPPPQDESELLIREARARQRKRWLGVATVVALLAGAALGIDSIAGGASPSAAHDGGAPAAAVKSGKACGVRVAWTKILDTGGHVLYREPTSRTMGHQMQCSGSNIWVVFFNGVAASQEAYFGVRSGDGGQTWRPVFAEKYFLLKAPHQLGSYMGPWTLHGSSAYFTGLCPACDPQPTVSLWVTKNGGRTFQRYDVRLLDTFWPTAIRVRGRLVSLVADRGGRRKTVTIRVD